MLKRLFDFSVSFVAIILFSTLLLIICICVKLNSKGPALYWSDRVGIDNVLFKMPKIRTMKIDTPVVPTHQLKNPQSSLTSIGGFLRRSSLDEIPQLWSVFKGDMSIVGPRPALFNQDDLITLRSEGRVEKLLPGLTGWAQVNGRDELSVSDKVRFDIEYLEKKSFVFDLKIIGLTIFKVTQRDSISH